MSMPPWWPALGLAIWSAVLVALRLSGPLDEYALAQLLMTFGPLVTVPLDYPCGTAADGALTLADTEFALIINGGDPIWARLLDANDGWLRKRFDVLGVIQFEDWVDTGEEYLEMDAVAQDRAAAGGAA